MEQIHSIYSKSYNFVYLRARSVLSREEDIQNLMKEVYVKAAKGNVAEDDIYAFLGKQTYMLGCQKYRKKKVREAEVIELREQDFRMSKHIDKEMTEEVIVETLEQFPDMYLGTLYAFYYDHMTVKEIATVMGYGAGAMVNRLNYVHKYLTKALEMRQEDIKTKVEFSVEALNNSLHVWSEKNVLNATVAQNIYAAICRELGIESILELQDGEDAGISKRIVPCDVNEVEFLIEALNVSKTKKPADKKTVFLIGGLIGILAVLALVVLLVVGSGNTEVTPDNLDEEKQTETVIDDHEEENVEEEQDETIIVEDESEVTQPDTEDDAQTGEEPDQSTEHASEYILPNSDTVKLTRSDLAGLSLEQLRLARNEIFARYGTIFGVEDLKNYFSSKSWYNPRITFDEFHDKVEMNAIEEANLALIVKVEEEIAQ